MLKFLFTLLAGGGIFMNIDKLKCARWKKLEGIIFIYKHYFYIYKILYLHKGEEFFTFIVFIYKNYFLKYKFLKNIKKNIKKFIYKNYFLYLKNSSPS